jgi:hypothetical protein
MIRSNVRARFAPAAGILCAGILLWSAAAVAEPAATWNQERVTGIAAKLRAAAEELYDQEYKSPDSFMASGTGGGAAQHEFMDRLRLLKHETGHLAASLGKGADAKATKGSVRRIKELNDDLIVYGRQIALENPVLDQFSAFEDLIHQITPYYGL